MNEAVLILAVCFALVTALLAASLVFSRWAAWVKTLLVILAAGGFFLHYAGLERLLGWPTSASLPERFLLLASSVREPDRASGDPGLIHLWLTSLDGAYPAEEPRAYTLPYSRDLHYELQEARRRQGEGVPQIGRRSFAAPADQPATDRKRFARPREVLRIEDLPDPVLPEK